MCWALIAPLLPASLQPWHSIVLRTPMPLGRTDRSTRPSLPADNNSSILALAAHLDVGALDREKRGQARLVLPLFRHAPVLGLAWSELCLVRTVLPHRRPACELCLLTPRSSFPHWRFNRLRAPEIESPVRAEVVAAPDLAGTTTPVPPAHLASPAFLSFVAHHVSGLWHLPWPSVLPRILHPSIDSLIYTTCSPAFAANPPEGARLTFPVLHPDQRPCVTHRTLWSLTHRSRSTFDTPLSLSPVLIHPLCLARRSLGANIRYGSILPFTAAMSTSTQDTQTTTVPTAAPLDPAMNAANDDTAAGAARSRKKMYKNCDRCRQAKRACSAQYVSIAEALANKVACKNCKKKGEVCTFNSLINSFGGIPLAGLTGAAFAESLQETSNGFPSENTSAAASNDMNIDETLASEPESSSAAERRRDSQSSIDNVNAVFELLNSCDDLVQPPAKRRKASALDSQQTFSSYAGFAQPASNAASNSLVLSRAQSPFAEDESDTSVFDILGFQIWGSAPSVRLAQTADRQHLNSDLLNVYEGAAESAFRVWVTDATTPYLLCADSLSSTSAAMSLNKKVTLLDHASKRIFKADNASRNVEKRVSEAYHAVLLAYAAQWPRHRNNQTASRAEWKPDEARIRLSLWKQARDKLMDAADAWSFRIVFALILFAWTEKPREVPDDEAWGSDNEPPAQLHEVPSLDENSALDSSSWQINAEASTMMLATAMRKLKAFRLKIQQLRRKGIDLWSTEEPGLEASQVAHRRAEATLLENTYHNLYWFGCMMDTELSVLRKYDAVIGDEDSDLTDQLLSPHRATSLRNETESFATGASAARKPVRKIWDEVIPANSQKNRHTFAKSWPCSEEDAKRTLAYATPIKVLLFRHVGRLQSSYWRQASSEQIERQITHVLSVVRHWDETFAPFFASCIAHHHELPPSIQSWHVITATKWNLAAILLVELVQTIDRSAASSDPFQNTDEIFAALRTKVCLNTAALIDAIQRSSLARVPSAESPFEFIHATDSTVLHSDPWPEISVHGFACVAKCEIKQFAQLAARSAWAELEAAEQRVHKCIWALDQLSNRSTMAVDASAEVAKLLEIHSPFKQ